MSELQEYIDAENAKTQAWVDAGPMRIAGMIPDADHYAKQGITTVAQFERNDMESTISDLAKDAYGTRSACPDITGMSDDELRATYDAMVVDLQDAMEQEAKDQALAIKIFEASVDKTMSMGSVGRKGAIKWLMEAEDDKYMSDDYFCYINGLPFKYLDE